MVQFEENSMWMMISPRLWMYTLKETASSALTKVTHVSLLQTCVNSMDLFEGEGRGGYKCVVVGVNVH